jgi:hypothetical protein
LFLSVGILHIIIAGCPAPFDYGGVSRMTRSMGCDALMGAAASPTGRALVDIRLMRHGFSTGTLLAG